MASDILRLPAVMVRTGLSRSTIYARVQQKTFPRQIKLGGPRAVGWLADEIDTWLSDQVDRSRSPGKIGLESVPDLES